MMLWLSFFDAVVVIVVVAGFVVAISVVFADVVAIHKTTYLQGSGELH